MQNSDGEISPRATILRKTEVAQDHIHDAKKCARLSILYVT